MMVKDLLDNLRVEVFYPRRISDGERKSFNEVYKLWKTIWIETRREVDPLLPTPSDNFGRQDEVITLFYRDRPIGLVCNRYIDLDQEWTIDDSFFSGSLWPKEIKATLRNHGRKVALASHAFIDPEFRKSKSGLPIKNIICALSFHQANAAKSDVFLAMMRKDKGMDDLIYRCGGVSLFEESQFFHIPVSLVAAYPAKQPLRIEPEIQEYLAKFSQGNPRFGRSFHHEFSESKLNQLLHVGDQDEFSNQNSIKRAS